MAAETVSVQPLGMTLILGVQKGEGSGTTQRAALQLGAVASVALACYFALNFIIPQSPGYMAYASAGLIGRLPVWSAVASLPLPVPQDAGAVISLALGATLALVLCYALALWVVRKATSSAMLLGIVVGGMLVFSLTSVFSMPNSSSDIYLYMVYAREINVYHANPFTTWPAAFAGDSYLSYAPAAWQYTTSLYGPIWTLLCTITGRLGGGDIVRDLLELRVLLFAINLANVALIWRIMARFRPAYMLTGVLFYAWNPIVVTQGLWHIEPLILFFLLLSVALYQGKRPSWGLVSMLLSATTKLVTAPLLVVYLFSAMRAKYVRYILVGAAATGAVTLFLLPDNLFTMRRLVTLPIFLGIVVWACVQQLHREQETTESRLVLLLSGWMAVMFTFSYLLAPTHYAWYLILLVGVACLMPSARVVILTITLAASGLVNTVLSDVATFYAEPSIWLYRVIWWVPTSVVLIWLFRADMGRISSRLFARPGATRRSQLPDMLVPSKHQPGPAASRIWLLRALVMLGMAALVYYFSWWWGGARILNPFLLVALVLAGLYNWVQLVGNWVLYIAARRRPAPPPIPDGLSVDVFVTCCKEPYDLIYRGLSAACAMRGEHDTYLLDDGDDPVLAAMASRLGAGYLTRRGRENAKAGNLNAALARTKGDIVVIFDIDHAPTPDFLERSLGYFADAHIGFVQVMLTFCNGKESWVARAAGESTLDYYNPTSVGMDGISSATLVGSNALIRRTALEGIGGYQPGLAEDLATSIALHAAGWSSAYVAEPLAPGLAPPDVPAWFTQQMKWARGVFELLLTTYPRLFPRLTWGQRLSYAVRMTYYWIGPVVSIHLLFLVALLFGGDEVATLSWSQYLVHIMPLAVITMLIRQAGLLAWRHPSTPSSILWRAICLVYSTWPIYTLAWMMAVVRVPLAFRPTPKSRGGRLNPVWLLPQAIAVILLVCGVVYSLLLAPEQESRIPVLFAAAQSLLLGLFLWHVIRERTGAGSHVAAPARIGVPTLALVEGPVPTRAHGSEAEESPAWSA